MIDAQVTSLHDFSGREGLLINCWSDTPSEHSSPKRQPPVKMWPRNSPSLHRKGRHLPTAHLITIHTSVSVPAGVRSSHTWGLLLPTPTSLPQTQQEWMVSTFPTGVTSCRPALKAVQAEGYQITGRHRPIRLLSPALDSLGRPSTPFDLSAQVGS